MWACTLSKSHGLIMYRNTHLSKYISAERQRSTQGRAYMLKVCVPADVAQLCAVFALLQKEEDDLAFLRSDDEDDELPPHLLRQQQQQQQQQQQEQRGYQPEQRQGMSRFGFKLEMNQEQQQQGHAQGGHEQGGTPSAGSLVGKKLTFDQLKQAAAAGGSGSPVAHQGPAGEGGLGGPPGMGTGGKVLTAAELEQQLAGGRPQGAGAGAAGPPGMGGQTGEGGMGTGWGEEHFVLRLETHHLGSRIADMGIEHEWKCVCKSPR